VVRQARYAWLFGFLILFAVNGHADTTARVARNTVSITDSFQVIFETDQDVSERPDFSPLQRNFDILGTSQSTSVNIINMSMRRSSRWVVDLMAKHEGELVIPAIIIGNEGTNIVKVTVKPATAAVNGAPTGEVYMEVEVDNPTPYVQGQFIYTVRLMRTVQTDNASLTEPHVNGGDVIVEKLGDDNAYETTRGGVRVSVVERRYALFAQNSGPVTIEPLLFEGSILQGNRSMFDPFARGRSIRVRSDAVKVDVQPIPANFSGPVWLPAPQGLLSESAPDSHQQYRAGEPFTRTLTLQATGLASSQLPEINAPVPTGIKQYPDQPVLENRVGDGGMVAIRQEKVALIPPEAGSYILPAIEIPWWNTQSNQREIARLPARTIEVLPALGLPAAVPPMASGDKAAAEVPAVPAREPPKVMPAAGNFWFWMCLILAIGWLATVLGWLLSRRQVTGKPQATRMLPNEKQLIVAIRTACIANDAQATKDALLRWAGFNWPGSPVRSLGELTARLDFALQKHVHELSQNIYRQTASQWHGEPLWQAFEARQKQPPPKVAGPKPDLEPLYR